MTYKIFGILKRPDGMTFEQFRKWWLEVHVPRVMKWPDIVAYEINFALNESEPFDGVAAVSFDSREAAEKIFQTPEGSSARSAAIAETSRNFIFLAEEVVIVPRPQVISDSGGVIGVGVGSSNAIAVTCSNAGAAR